MTGYPRRHLDLDLLAGESLLQGDFPIVAQIAAALASAAGLAAAHKLTEDIVENVGKRGEPAGRRAAAKTAPLKGLVAEPVIGGTLLRIG